MLIVSPDAQTCRTYANALEMPGAEEFQRCIQWCDAQITLKCEDAHIVLQADVIGDCKGLVVFSLRGSDSVNMKFFAFLVYKDTGSWAISPYIHGHPLTPPV